jgi:hypothetical protein
MLSAADLTRSRPSAHLAPARGVPIGFLPTAHDARIAHQNVQNLEGLIRVPNRAPPWITACTVQVSRQCVHADTPWLKSSRLGLRSNVRM